MSSLEIVIWLLIVLVIILALTQAWRANLSNLSGKRVFDVYTAALDRFKMPWKAMRRNDPPPAARAEEASRPPPAVETASTDTPAGEAASLSIPKSIPTVEAPVTTTLAQRAANLRTGTLVELGLIAAWALWVGRAYLDFDPFMWPVSREIGAQLNTHYFWILFKQCGLCALWDGTINGGIPALADTFGSKLHPLVMVVTLIWGVMVGAKVAIVICFLMAGYAQWWIARLMGLGWIARLWSAFLIIVGGHLSARMVTGQFGVILSIASCSLALAAAIDLGLTGQRRSTLVLALHGALVIVSGQGYLQLSLLSWAPAFLFFLLDKNFRLRLVWKEYVLAVVLSVLIAGVFLIPTMHFWPNFSKASDPSFKSAQPLEYAPLNLVIRDMNFMSTAILGKSPTPELFTTYIGWVPILLAMISLHFLNRKDARVLLCLITGTIMSFLMGSAIPLKWLVNVLSIFSGFRHPSLMGMLVVPPIVALAAYALDRVLRLNWSKLEISFSLNPAFRLSISLAWLLFIPLYWSISIVYETSHGFLKTSNFQPIYLFYDQMQHELDLRSIHLIAPPFGEQFMVEPAINRGLKLTGVVFPSRWEGRPAPEPEFALTRDQQLPIATLATTLSGISIYRYPERPYAYVDLGNRKVPCESTGHGGDLTVICSTDSPGQLIVQENSWQGWYAWRDQQPVSLIDQQWLGTQALAGKHIYEFQYRPWDVGVGLFVTLFGLALTIWLWLRSLSDQPHSQPINENAT